MYDPAAGLVGRPTLAVGRLFSRLGRAESASAGKIARPTMPERMQVLSY